MKVISALLVVAAAAVASAAAYDDDGDNWVPPPGYKAYPEGRWCNHGTAGDKGCEAQAEHSYCCVDAKTPYFNTWRQVTVTSKNDKGTTSCENGGTVWCA
ncbi:hypothetical protein E4U30_002321 [Claviceps sp. LM220 group G6]|nr:hypothetical protein E4U31_004599 [Claviceps sp. LM219 group G6]KAG6102784.1 hypothetical protein E4U30_002321 [Claviceps sp. LM220 group G6]KAG6104296.1 hypothetical protein E4U14_005847 [Claviceps sp. LM454 group G7]